MVVVDGGWVATTVSVTKDNRKLRIRQPRKSPKLGSRRRYPSNDSAFTSPPSSSSLIIPLVTWTEMVIVSVVVALREFRASAPLTVMVWWIVSVTVSRPWFSPPNNCFASLRRPSLLERWPWSTTAACQVVREGCRLEGLWAYLCKRYGTKEEGVGRSRSHPGGRRDAEKCSRRWLLNTTRTVGL